MFSAQLVIEVTASEPPAEAAAAAEPVASDTEAPKEEVVCAIPRFVCDMVLIILQKEEKKVWQTAAKVGH